jgi:hypothetical protein
MNERLVGIEAKLDRAQEHLTDIQARGLAWLAEEETWEFPPHINEGQRRIVVSLRLAKPPPPVLALMTDEVVHHLRSSLDHLASYLVERGGGEVGRAAWPIVGSQFGWDRMVERRHRRWEVWRKKGGGPLGGTTSEMRAFVESKQPYHGPGKAREDPLFELNDLWNGYKHRVLNPIHVVAVPAGSWRDLFHPTPEIEPVEFKWVLKPRDKLELGAERTLAVLVFPKSQPLPKVEMKGEIPVKPFIGDGEPQGQGLSDDLSLIRVIVAEAIERFPPPKS